MHQKISIIGAMTSCVLVALYKKAAPLLVSKSLIANICAHKTLFNEFASRSTEALTATYGPSITFSHSRSTETFKRHCTYTKRMYQEVHKEIAQFAAQGNNNPHTLLELLALNSSFFREKSASFLASLYT